LQIMPGGALGGLFSDSAQVGNVTYVNGSNSNAVLFGGPCMSSGESAPCADGTIAALQTTPNGITQLWRFTPPQVASGSGTNLAAQAGIAVAKGVVYATMGSIYVPEFRLTENVGVLYALDARNGSVLSSIQLPRTSFGGVAVAEGYIYFGTGLDALGGANSAGEIIAVGN
jgi:hypothetical protein